MSLAQMFFDGEQVEGGAFKEDFCYFWRSARDFLNHGIAINHSAPAHKCLADIAAAEAAKAAQRFRVAKEDYLPLADLGRQFHALGIPVRVPAVPMWIETPGILQFADKDLLGTIGALLISGSQPDRYEVIYYTDAIRGPGDPSVAMPYVAGMVDLEHDTGTVSVAVAWNAFYDLSSREDAALEMFSALVQQTFALVSALNTPRVVTKTAVTHQPPLQKARLRRGKHPLLSFNQVQIHLPKVSQHSGDTMRPERGGGVRFHGVLGHLRRIERPYGPDVTWVSPHFRGDPRLGVVVKERAVRVVH